MKKYLTENKFYIAIDKTIQEVSRINEAQDERWYHEGDYTPIDWAKKSKSSKEFIEKFLNNKIGARRSTAWSSDSKFRKEAERFWETINGKYPNFSNSGVGGPDSASASKLAQKYKNLDEYIKYMYKTFPSLEKNTAMKDRLTKIHKYFNK